MVLCCALDMTWFRSIDSAVIVCVIRWQVDQQFIVHFFLKYELSGTVTHTRLTGQGCRFVRLSIRNSILLKQSFMNVKYSIALFWWVYHVAESGCPCGALMVSAGCTADVACCFFHWCPGHSKQVVWCSAGNICKE